MNVFVTDLLNVVTGQQAPDFNFLLTGLVVYLLVLWFAFCVWVFVDAHRRFDNLFVAALISVVVLILNFPALIFYLVVRPEDEQARAENHTGVEVPVVKFVDAQGNVRLALNLEISGQQNPQSDMTVSVAWDSNRQDIDINRKNTGEKYAEIPMASDEVVLTDKTEKVQKLAKLFSRKKSRNLSEDTEPSVSSI